MPAGSLTSYDAEDGPVTLTVPPSTPSGIRYDAVTSSPTVTIRLDRATVVGMRAGVTVSSESTARWSEVHFG